MTEKMLARVAVSSVPYAADRLYTYLVPDELIGSAEAGKRVTIPFGRGNRRVEGFLLEVGREAATSPLKPIDSLLDDAPLLDAKDIRLVRWMKARYFCTYYDAIKTILPGGVWLQYRELWHVNGEISAEDALSSVAPDSLEETLLRAMLSAKEIERGALDELGGEKTAKALRSLEACGLAVRETKLRQRLQDKSVRMMSLCVSAEDALAYLDSAPVPTVIKADGLALGKGVIIAATRDEAKDAVVEIMRDKKFGKSGDSIVIEEFLTGPEVSVLSFTDGKTVVPMVSSMDHKRALDNDGGLNTGGMGTVAPNPYYTEEIAERCMKEIFLPTVNAMNAEGRTFKGCLYFGLMLTENGPKVIEFNARFGDRTPFKINGNVINDGSITNLPYDACVEIPVFADKDGIHKTIVGELPAHLAILVSTTAQIENLVVRAAMTKSRADVYHAVMMDPLCSAVCSLQEIRDMCDLIFEKNTDYLGDYK